MNKNIRVAPSILSADFSRLGEEIKKIEESGADMVHVDVMDGCFVPNITIGPVVVGHLRKCTKLCLDVHLMIEEPAGYVKDFAEAGSDIITVHAEAGNKRPGTRGAGRGFTKGMSRSLDEIDETDLVETLKKIKSFGKKAGLSLNPDTPFCVKNILNEVDMILIMSVHPGFGGQKFIDSVLPKIKEARSFYNGDIEVDGGINDENAPKVIDAGGNILVAGSYFFTSKDRKQAVRKLRVS